ncbi:MAG: hypothetical protein ACXWZF_12305 [Actinomycetota bacterium]
MSDLPRTTTTGDPAQDLRTKGDGARDRSDDPLHHAEDDRLIAHTKGFLGAWRERLRRGSARSERER